MPEFHLEFEKPVIELKKKIEELKNFSEHNSIDVSEQIDALTVRLNEMIKEIYTSLTPWQRVQLARHPERPYTLDYIEHLFTNFIELSGDRRFRDDKAIVGGFAKFRGKPVMVIGTQKGRDMLWMEKRRLETMLDDFQHMTAAPEGPSQNPEK